MATQVFKSFAHMAQHAQHIMMATPLVTTAGLHAAADVIKKKMDPMFGHYQTGQPPFQTWPELADSTKQERVAKGFAENEPLLRSGKLRDSYHVQSGSMWAGVGSDSIIALTQEIGDPRHNLPARSTLGLAFVRHERAAFVAACAPLAALYLTGKRTVRLSKP